MIHLALNMLYIGSKKNAYMDRSTNRSLCGARLVNLLSDTSRPDQGTFRNNFAERLGEMFHFRGTVELAAVLDAPSRGPFNPSGQSAGAVRDAFLVVQGDLVRFIAKSFLATSARVQNRLPNAEALHAHCCTAGIFPKNSEKKSKPCAVLFDPYLKFYVNRQRTIDIKVRRLRAEIRHMISGMSPELADLGRLDQALEDSIAGAPQESLAKIPSFLEKRFGQLLDSHWHEIPDDPGPEDLEPWMAPGGWISAFCSDMRELLFAELEVRLQPVMGMVESLPRQSRANLRGQSS